MKPPTSRGSWTAKGGYLALSTLVFALDQWTKWLVEIELPPLASRELVAGFLNLTHLQNTGVAFGLFASDSPWGPRVLIGLGLAALGMVTAYLWRAPRRQRLLLVALALVLGGAAGNLVDRVARGAVTDFVDVYLGAHHWPAFNVADSAISVALVLLLVDAFRPPPGAAEGVAGTSADIR